MTASLHHAQSILAAAINAGFRESGVQSLKNLEEIDSFPMVAVRTSGIAFESLIGYVEECDDGEELARLLVSEEYLRLLIQIGNERFVTNRERTRRFKEGIFEIRHRGSDWESAEVRREKRKASGLARQAAAQRGLDSQGENHSDGDTDIFDLAMLTSNN